MRRIERLQLAAERVAANNPLGPEPDIRRETCISPVGRLDKCTAGEVSRNQILRKSR
jgi:hypothetical protein